MNENLKKKLIKSIIYPYLCYYIRLIDKGRRGNFEYTLREILLKIVNIHWEAIEEKKKVIFSL